MSAFSGRHGRGAMRTHRQLKREEAEARNLLTPTDRRRAYRRGLSPEARLLLNIFGTKPSAQNKGAL